MAGFAGKFIHDDDGAALTEYVVLLGILVLGVISAVNVFGAALANLWLGWEGWMSSGEIMPPTS